MLDKLIFLDTRIEGVKTVWEALRFACQEPDIDLLLARLNSAGVRLIKKSLQMSYCKDQYRYDIPVFLINEPSDYEIPEVVTVQPVIEKDIKV